MFDVFAKHRRGKGRQCTRAAGAISVGKSVFASGLTGGGTGCAWLIGFQCGGRADGRGEGGEGGRVKSPGTS